MGFSYMINMLYVWVGLISIWCIVMCFFLLVMDDDYILVKGEVVVVWEENGEILVDCKIWLECNGVDCLFEGEVIVCIYDLC